MSFLSSTVRSRLVRLLQPWLQEEPVIDIELGFLRSRVRLRNLVFNVSALDPHIEGLDQLSLRSLTVGEITARISPWESPAFDFEVNGIDVTLAPREVEEEGCLHGLKNLTDLRMKEMKHVLSLLDPEGIYLHETIEKISAVTFSRNWFMTATSNIALKHCRLKIYDIHFQMLLSLMDESLACFLRVKELHVESLLPNSSCLLRGLIGAFFIPQVGSSFTSGVGGLEIGLKRKDHVKCVASSGNVSICFQLNNLQIHDFDTRVPQLKLDLSPVDLPIILVVFNMLSSKEARGARDGRELWKIAAQGIGCLVPRHRSSFCKLVSAVVLWLRYARAYQSLLLLVGYPAENTFIQTAIRMPVNKKFSSCVKQQLKLVSDLEKELPAEAIARARQVARYRVALHFQSSSSVSTTDVHSKFWSKVLSPFLFLWKVICHIFCAVRYFFFICQIEEKLLLHSDRDDSYSTHWFSLNLGEISITLSPSTAVHHFIEEKSELDIQLPDLNLLSFCITINMFCLIYMESTIARSLHLACGDFKIQLSSLSRSELPLLWSRSGIERHHSSRGHQPWTDNESKPILWSEPAPHFHISNNESVKITRDSWILILQNYLGEMWSDWNGSGKIIEANNIQYLESPFLLFEVKSFLMDPYINMPDSGLWKCCLAVGKLNCNMDYLSIMSISLLLKQIQHVCCRTATSEGAEVLSHSSGIIEEQKSFESDNLCHSFAEGVKKTMLRLVPEKNMQIGVMIIGPSIRISSIGEGLPGAKERVGHPKTWGLDDCCFGIDLENIECAIWPTSLSVLSALIGKPRLDEAEAKCLSFVDAKSVDSQITDLTDNCSCRGCFTLSACVRCNGINVFLEDFKENQKYQVFGPMPIIIQPSSCREYWRSLAETENALSVNFIGMATGSAILCYMDELCIFFQVVEGLFVLSDAFINLDSSDEIYFQDLIRKHMSSTKSKLNSKMSASEVKCSVYNLNNTKFVMEATLDVGRLDFILSNSRENHVVESHNKANDASSSATVQEIMATKYKKTLVGMSDVPEFGIGVSIQQSCVQISMEDALVKVLFDVRGIQSIIFGCQNQIAKCTDGSELRNLFRQPFYHLYEFSLSDCTISICAGPPRVALSSGNVSNVFDGTNASSARSSHSMEGSDLEVSGERSRVQSCDPSQELGQCQLLAVNVLEPASGCQLLLINIGLSEILMVEHSVKNVLVGAHQPKKFQCSISIGGEFHTLSSEVQGGTIILEITALATFIHCFRTYLLCFRHLCSCISSGKQSEKVDTLMVLGEGLPSLSDHMQMEHAQDAGSSILPSEMHQSSPERNRKIWEIFTISLSKFSLILAVANGSGGAWELMLEADFLLKLELMDIRRKFLFDLFRLTVLSQHPQKICSDRTGKDVSIPHFLSHLSNDASSYTEARYSISSEITESRLPVLDHNSSTSKEGFLEVNVSPSYVMNQGNDILKHVVGSIMVEKTEPYCEVTPLQLKSHWVGSGSISGVDLTITISELQMLLAMIESFSGISGGQTSHDSNKGFGSWNQHVSDSSEYTIPDGAIVAIQDLHQHLYFAVEAVENTYHLGGSIHFSLAGERALFRVHYHKQWSWRSPVSWFSLMSLYAKNDAGQPLRLNFHPGSGFVDVSSTDDRAWALWRIFPYRTGSYEAVNDLESYYQSNRKAFYLVNKKSNCAVAFVDGLPEFVKKPGNPFKVKVFNNFSLTQGILSHGVPDDHSDKTCETNKGEVSTSADKGESSVQTNNLPYVNITIDKVTLTIFHEVPDTNYKFPLLRGSIDNIQFIFQDVPSKMRLISTFTAGIYYYDGRKNLWREIVFPVEACLFYRCTYLLSNKDIAQRGVPVRLYFRMGHVDVSLTELSLDILLFLVGKMNLAGPYAVKHSMIFMNCCKVENRTGLSLLCHFDDNQDVRIAGKQSASVFLRRESLADQLPENASKVSLQLVALGTFSTSSIHLSLSNSRVLAWRTRVASLQDSKTSPGPFLVVDVSRKYEEGLLVVVSPMLRIHNASGFSMELRFRRPHETEAEYASILLRNGDTIDDCMAVFDALNLAGSLKKALVSLSLGNFLLSFRPEITEHFENPGKPFSVEWSEDLKGGKAVRLSGIFDKLNYRFKKAFGVESVKSSFSTIHCTLNVEDSQRTNLHFLVQTVTRDVPVIKPHNLADASETSTSPVALQEQREIFLFPTVQVYNLLQSDIHVLLSESYPDLRMTSSCYPMGKQETIPCGSSAYFYANPAIIYFAVTLAAYDSKCKPVNSGDWIKKLQRQKTDVHYLDIELDFGGGRYFASLRLSRGDRGILEAIIFTPYTLQNDTHLSLFCHAPNQKPLSRVDVDKYGSILPPELGSMLPPKSTTSWFLKSSKVFLKRLEDTTSEALLDLDALSGFTELCLELLEEAGVKHVEKLGVSLKPNTSKAIVPSQIVFLVPRHVISNESEEGIIFRQCYLQDDPDGTVEIDSHKKIALPIRIAADKRKEISFFDSMFKKHKNANMDSVIFIQFSLKEIGWSWSGPICISSLGRFFLKFRRSSLPLRYKTNSAREPENKLICYAAVHIVEESSTLVLHFHMPPKFAIPYRIENCLSDATITYYQKESSEAEILGPGSSVEYVWDDLNLPHKLIVQITGTNLSRDININKVCAWKPLLKVRQTRGLPLHVSWDKRSRDGKNVFDESPPLDMLKVGYKIYADGSTRVLRICEFNDNNKEDKIIQPCLKIQFRMSSFAIHLLESGKQDVDWNEASAYSTIVVAKLGNITLDSMFTDQYKFNQIKVQALNVDVKWQGAPFAAMLRRNRLDDDEMNQTILYIVFVLDSTESNVKQVKNSSICLQPVDLNIDEETLMRLVPFWRTSLSDSNTPSRQFYFKHFEIHPIKIIASFLPGSPNSSYSSAQEALRSLLHSVIKIPAVKSMVVELNGVLLTHALVTARELFIKCAQHYSWYAVRAIYIAKGSILLPPAFASIFDDSASSSLDVFFDPSSGLVNLPGFTLGMFKFISKCINTKGFSGTKRYFGDLGKTMKTAGSNVLFVAITEISDNVLKGAEASGFNGMVNGFHQGILKLAMEPSVLGMAVLEGGPDRKIKLDRSPGVEELYIEGYLQAMLDATYKQEYLRVRVIDDQVILKNLPPNSSLINEIMEHVKSFLMSKALLKGEPSMTSSPLRHLRGENEWKLGPTVLTLCEHLFVSFAIRMLRKQANKFIGGIKWKGKLGMAGTGSEIVVASGSEEKQGKNSRKWAVGKFALSGLLAYVDGRLCRFIPNAIARRIVSGFLLSFLDKDNSE